jgi:LysM repeat protein
MPRARSVPWLRAVVGASLVLSLCAIDFGVAFAADSTDSALQGQAQAPTSYQVRKGDSLSSIARRNGVSVAALASANNIRNVQLIVVGQWLVIPSPALAGSPLVTPTLVPAAVPAPRSVEIVPAAGPTATPVIYVLKRGDNLGAVARKYKVTVSALAAANGIRNPNRVTVGLRLVIPSAAVPASATTVAAPTTTVATLVADTSTTTLPAVVAAVATPTLPVTPTSPPTTSVTAASTVPAAALVAAPTLTPEQLARLPKELLNLPDRLALMPSFDRWAAEYAVPPSLLKALAWMESGWQATVVSPSGAIGIGQLLPSTAGFVAGVLIGAPLDPFVADDNIRMSARFLAHLVSLTNGDVNMALAGYYQGLTSVRRDGMKATTAAYVNVVLALQARF